MELLPGRGSLLDRLGRTGLAAAGRGFQAFSPGPAQSRELRVGGPDPGECGILRSQDRAVCEEMGLPQMSFRGPGRVEKSAWNNSDSSGGQGHAGD